MRLAWLCLALLPLAGCMDPQDTYAVSGSFTEDRTDADIQELRDLGQQHGGDVQIRESFPEQFTVSDMSSEDCETLHAILVEKEYLVDVGGCGQAEGGADPY